jgi:type IV pilus assembly protein PilB
VRESASEIHLEPGPQRLVVRLRRDGVLALLRELPAALAEPLLRCVEQQAGIDVRDGAPHREGWFCLERKARSLQLRASFLATPSGESVVLRIRDRERGAIALGALGLLPSMQRRLEEEVLSASGGVFLIAGPAGSGRTATLHACALAVAGPATRVVLLEDTLEARLEGVSQSVALPADAAPLAERVAIALRQDPDVILLGALREHADIAAALRSARFGPRVFGVLEAEDAVTAIRLALAAGEATDVAASSLTGALGQRLVRRVCAACAGPVVPAAAQLRRLGCTPLEVAGGSFQAGRGCGRCRETGYDGRMGLFELLLLDGAARDPLHAGDGAAALRRRAALVGPSTLLEDGLFKAARGLTTLDELLRVVPRALRPRPVAEIERLSREG